MMVQFGRKWVRVDAIDALVPYGRDTEIMLQNGRSVVAEGETPDDVVARVSNAIR